MEVNKSSKISLTINQLNLVTTCNKFQKKIKPQLHHTRNTISIKANFV